MVRKIPTQKTLAKMSDEELRERAVAVGITALERDTFLREIAKREAAGDREARLLDGLDLDNPEDQLRYLRRRIKDLIVQFGEGRITPAKAAWEVSQHSGISYKHAEQVVTIGYELMEIDGIRARDGVQAAEQRRNLLPKDSLAIWMVVMKGTWEEISEYAVDPAALEEKKVPKTSRKAAVVEAVLDEGDF